ncbi:hypothetical protein EDB80DRAFT_683580 [Ilyonectria destructans]|nr:hypothetical protein EDB80DRAFT_683580 [Ilyonectria destructans]
MSAGLEHPVESGVPSVDEQTRVGNSLTSLDDDVKQCLSELLSQTPNLIFEGASQNTIQHEPFRKKGKPTSAEGVDATSIFMLVDSPKYLSPFVVAPQVTSRSTPTDPTRTSTALFHRPHSVTAKEKRTGIESSFPDMKHDKSPDERSHLDPRDKTTLVHRGTRRSFSEVEEVSLNETLPTFKDIKRSVSGASNADSTSEDELVAGNTAEEGDFHEVQGPSKTQTTFETQSTADDNDSTITTRLSGRKGSGEDGLVEESAVEEEGVHEVHKPSEKQTFPEANVPSEVQSFPEAGGFPSATNSPIPARPSQNKASRTEKQSTADGDSSEEAQPAKQQPNLREKSSCERCGRLFPHDETARKHEKTCKGRCKSCRDSDLACIKSAKADSCQGCLQNGLDCTEFSHADAPCERCGGPLPKRGPEHIKKCKGRCKHCQDADVPCLKNGNRSHSNTPGSDCGQGAMREMRTPHVALEPEEPSATMQGQMQRVHERECPVSFPASFSHEHLAENKYVCSRCDQAYGSAITLSQHVARCRGKCDQCKDSIIPCVWFGTSSACSSCIDEEIQCTGTETAGAPSATEVPCPHCLSLIPQKSIAVHEKRCRDRGSLHPCLNSLIAPHNVLLLIHKLPDITLLDDNIRDPMSQITRTTELTHRHPLDK